MQHKPQKRHKALQPLSREHHHGLLLSWKIRSGFNKKGIIPAIPILTFKGLRFEFLPKLILMNRFFECISKEFKMPEELKQEIEVLKNR